MNWDTHLQTAVADDEIYYEETKGHLWTIAYPVVGSAAGERLHRRDDPARDDAGRYGRGVHPEDPRYAHLIGEHGPLAAQWIARSRSSAIRYWSIPLLARAA